MVFDPLISLPDYFPELFPYLETERLILRENSPEIVRKVFGTYSNAALMSFYDLPNDAAVVSEKESLKKGYETVSISFCNWVMIEKSSKTVIGHMGFHTWHQRYARAEIGFGLVSDDVQGKGFATEGIKAVLEYGFIAMNIHRIEAMVSPENERSKRLLEKNGFVKEAVLHEHVFRNGIADDSIVYRLLRKEFEKKAPKGFA